MRKILLLVFGACILVLLTAGTLYAKTMILPLPGSASISAEGDNGIKSLDVPLNLEDQLFSWLNTISEAMGLKVSHNTDIHAISISDPEKIILKERVKLLEAAVSPSSPQETADTWAQGVLDGNGALQLALLSADLNKVYQPVMESYACVLRGVGPSFSSYQLESQTIAAEDVYKYVIRFQSLVSTEDIAPQIATLQVEKSRKIYGRDAWMVTDVDYPLSSIYHDKQTNQMNNNLAHIIPTMTGIVRDIKEGRLYLDNVHYSMDPRNPDEPKPDPVLVLPNGCWLNDHHWQSDRDRIDLFLHYSYNQLIYGSTAKTLFWRNRYDMWIHTFQSKTISMV